MTKGSSSASDRLLASLVWCWIVVLLSIVVSSYFAKHFTDAISFRIDDGWCPPEKVALGLHCFGDFGHPYLRGGYPVVYSEGNSVILNSPFVLAVFEILNLLPYELALWIFLAFASFAMALPILWAVWNERGDRRALAVFVCGVGTLGFIATIDRANPVAFIPLIALGSVVMIDQEKWFRAAIIVAVGSAIKFWFPMMLIPFIVRRKYKELFLSVSLIGIFHLLPLLAFPGNYLTNLRLSLKAVFSSDLHNGFQPYAISVVSLIRRIACAWRDGGTCFTTSTNWGFEASPIFGACIALALIAWAAICFHRYPPKTVMRYAPLLSLGVLALPTAQTYNSVLFISVTALIFKWERIDGSESKLWSLSLVLCSALPPYALFYVGDSVFSSTNSSYPGPMFRLHYFLIPVASAVWILHTTITTRNRKARITAESEFGSSRV